MHTPARRQLSLAARLVKATVILPLWGAGPALVAFTMLWWLRQVRRTGLAAAVRRGLRQGARTWLTAELCFVVVYLWTKRDVQIRSNSVSSSHAYCHGWRIARSV